MVRDWPEERQPEARQEEDEQLLVRWHRGEQRAFDQLFERHYPHVLRVVTRLVANHEDAEDVCQEAFFTLYNRPPAVRELGGGVAAWLMRVALNRGYNLLRAGGRAAQRLSLAYEPESGIDPQSEALRNAERAAVRTVLRQLPERQAQLLALRHAGYSYQEIAAALQITPSSIGTLLARAEQAFEQVYRRQRE